MTDPTINNHNAQEWMYWLLPIPFAISASVILFFIFRNNKQTK